MVPMVSAAAPTVTTNSTTNISTTSATLNGYLNNNGSKNSSVWFQYGLTDSYGSITSRDYGDIITEEVEDGFSYSGDALTNGTLAEAHDGDWDTYGGIFEDDADGSLDWDSYHYFEMPSFEKKINISFKIGTDIVGNNAISFYLSIYNYEKSQWDPWQGFSGFFINSEESEIYYRDAHTTYNANEYVNPSNSTIKIRFDGTILTNSFGGYAELDFYECNVSFYEGCKTGDEFNATLTGLTSSTTYHYRSVANNSDGESYGADMTFHTMPPDPVTNETWVFDSNTQTLTLNWTLGNYSNYTLIRKSADSYPSSVTDGTLVYNNTNNGTTDTDLDQAYLYTLWAYNSTWNSYSSPVFLNWSASWLNCYNENNNSNISCWDIEISNATGSTVYYETCVNNSHIINISDLPTGNNVIFTFSAENYETRSYVMNVNDVINLNAYLPPSQDQNIHYTSESISDPSSDAYVLLNCDPGTIVQVEGYNESLYGHWYTIPDDQWSITDNNVTVNQSVLDDNTSVVRVTYYCDIDVLDYIIHVINNMNNPLNEAKIQVKRLIDDTYENVLSVLTDGNGDAACYLIPDQHYKIIISKDGYDDGVADWIPSVNIRTKTYILDYESTVNETYDFYDFIDFNATMYENKTIKVIFVDHNENTTSAIFETYEIYNDSSTLNSTNNTNENTFTFWVTGVNTSRVHEIQLTLTHAVLGTVVESVFVNPLHTSLHDINNIELIFSNILGNWSTSEGGLGYVNFFFILIPSLGLIAIPGRYHHPGVGVVMAAGYIGFVTSIVFSNVFISAPFIAAIGLVLIAVKGGVMKL